jgi:uncharacterized lipoprotein YmbA
MTMRWLWILLACLLANCGGGRGPATTYYKLDIPPAPMPSGPSAPASLRIEPFRVSSFLRQDRIVYFPSPVQVGYYEYHRWAEPPNDSVTKALADQLKGRRIFRSVEVSAGGPRVDYVLRGRIERLQEVDYRGPVRVEVSISAELEDPERGQVIWSNAASSESAVAKSDVGSVVAAMGKASQQSIARLMADVAKFVQVNRLSSATAGATPSP